MGSFFDDAINVPSNMLGYSRAQRWATKGHSDCPCLSVKTHDLSFCPSGELNDDSQPLVNHVKRYSSYFCI